MKEKMHLHSCLSYQPEYPMGWPWCQPEVVGKSQIQTAGPVPQAWRLAMRRLANRVQSLPLALSAMLGGFRRFAEGACQTG
jgi:hypothetical protein